MDASVPMVAIAGIGALVAVAALQSITPLPSANPSRTSLPSTLVREAVLPTGESPALLLLSSSKAPQQFEAYPLIKSMAPHWQGLISGSVTKLIQNPSPLTMFQSWDCKDRFRSKRSSEIGRAHV